MTEQLILHLVSGPKGSIEKLKQGLQTNLHGRYCMLWDKGSRNLGGKTEEGGDLP